MDADQENNVEAATTMPCQPLPPPYMAPQFQDDGYAATPGYYEHHIWPTDPPSCSREYNKPVHDEYTDDNVPLLDRELPHHQQFEQFQQPNIIIVEQPRSVSWPTNVPLTNPPKDYMCYSVFVTVCCCWLIGVFAIIKSAECRAAIKIGDRATAELKSREARSKAHSALVCGIILSVIFGIINGIIFGLKLSRPDSF